MKIKNFDFILPRHCIAQRPVKPRDRARLLIADGMIDETMADLHRYLKPGDIVVLNDTKVIPARLAGKCKKSTVEVTLHMQISPNIWSAFARPARKLKINDRIYFRDNFFTDVIEKLNGGEVMLSFNKSDKDLMHQIEKFGTIPLPPYIKRKNLSDKQDISDYQTLHADKKGAVAAPTAGLHFTPKIMRTLKAKGIKIAMITLHVGAGTFLPVRADEIEDHVMHFEWGEITKESTQAINSAKASGGRVIAVGTTSLRLLETATDSSTGMLKPFNNKTNLFITPGYRFRIVDFLLTNFHLPRSTLFMLVSAFSGLKSMKEIYETAITRGYRFYSYGDGCLLKRIDQK